MLFLDEPTTGVDPVSRKEFWEMLKQLKKQNISIVVSTPYMDEANMCDEIALIQSGKLLSVDTPANIIKSYPEQLYAIKADNMHALLKVLRGYDRVMSSYTFGEYAHVSFKDPEVNLNEVSLYLKQQGLTATELKKTAVTIEDSFIKLL